MNSLNERRADHLDREGIRFCIGQVCQHKKFGYRGIVFQWDHRPVSDAVSTFEGVIGTPRGSNQPFYHILPDFNDAIAFFGGVRDVRYVCEDNLEPVVEPYFNRVYSPHASEIFQAPAVFCPEGGVFLPSRQLSYVYPSDVSALEAVATYSVEEMQELAKRPTYDGKYLSQWASEILSDVLVKVQQERVWEECEAGRGGGGGFDAETDSTLSALEEAWGHFPWSFYSLSLGKGVSENSIQSSITQSSSSYGSNSSDWFRNMLPGISPCRAVRNELIRVIKEAEESSVQWNRGYHAAAALVGFYNGLQGLLQRRKTSMRDGAHVEFQIGDVVRHHSWGYRAVIASFDCRPNLDSMHWDGVTDLKNGPVQPFYTLLPDLHDVKEALGEPQPTLYIAQESLERTTGGLVRSPLLKLFFSNYSTSLNRFMPLEGMRFRFPSPSYYTGTTTSQEGLGGEPNRHCRTALALERIVSDIRLKLQSCEKKGQLVGSLENLLQGARSKWEADTVDILQRKLSESKLDSSAQQAWRNIEVLSSHRQYQYVIAELHELLRTDPEGDLAALIHQKLAHLYLKSGDYGRSIESAGYVLDSEPSQRNRIDCLTVRGQALLKVSLSCVKNEGVAFRLCDYGGCVFMVGRSV